MTKYLALAVALTISAILAAVRAVEFLTAIPVEHRFSAVMYALVAALVLGVAAKDYYGFHRAAKATRAAKGKAA